MRRLIYSVRYYLLNWRQLRGRVGRISIKGVTISHMYRALLYLMSRPRLASLRLLNALLGGPRRQVGAEPAALANVLYNDAIVAFEQDHENVGEAIRLLELAAAVHDAPRIAIRLAEFQSYANRHDAASETFRKALRKQPTDRDLWHHALVHLMRIGPMRDAETLIAEILAIEPNYPLACFFKRLIDAFPGFTDTVSAALTADPADGRRSHILGFSVWGPVYTDLFLNYTLASLLAEGNLPAASKSRQVHLIIFTTEADAAVISAAPIFQRAQEFCRSHFIIFDTALFAAAQSQNRPLAVQAGFGLLSGAHYAILEAARRHDADATLIGSDNIVNDCFLSSTIGHADTGETLVGAVTCPGFRLVKSRALAATNAAFRDEDGTIRIPGTAFSRLLDECLPDEVFVEARDFARFPLFLCWRVGNAGVLTYANHHHPVLIRGSALKEIRKPSIDPIDGRFLSRYLREGHHLAMAKDNSICLVDAAETPTVVPARPFRRTRFDPRQVALWLWQYDDGLRESYLRTAIRFPFGDRSAEDWVSTEQKAQHAVNETIEHLRKLNAHNCAEASWKLPFRDERQQ